MSKTETVRALDDTGPQLQIVASIRALEQTVKALQADLAALPLGVAQKTATALLPVAQLRQDIEVALTAFDRLQQLQRDSLVAMGQELTQTAAAACSHQAQAMAASVTTLTTSSQSIATTAQQLVACRQIAGEMQQTANAMHQAAWTQQERAERWLSPWRQAVGLLLAALLAAIGVTVLGRLLPPLSPTPTELIGNPSH